MTCGFFQQIGRANVRGAPTWEMSREEQAGDRDRTKRSAFEAASRLNCATPIY